MRALPPSLLPPALPSSLCSDGSPGEAEIAGELWLCAFLSGQLFTPKGPHTKSAQSGTRTAMGTALFMGIILPAGLKEPHELTHSCLSQNYSCQSGFSLDTALLGRLP